MPAIGHFHLKDTDLLLSYAGNWELVKSIGGQNLKEDMFVYILKRELDYER